MYKKDHLHQILAQAVCIHSMKIEQYGTDRYNCEDFEVDLWMCYSDIYRKQIRLKKLVKKAQKFGINEHLKETLYDMLNYVAMFIQILEIHEQEGTDSDK